MSTLTITKTYSDTTILNESDLDNIKNDTQTTVNGLLDTTSNINFGGTIHFNKGGNDSFGWDDSTDTLKLTVDAVDVLSIVEAAASVTLKAKVSDADFIFNVNDGGVDTAALTLDGATANVQIHKLLADTNANEIIDLGATASAVNHIKVTNAATGNAAKIEALGDDTN